ncbi:hypothetical protein Theos_2243 (plasmid) [Thermus oshimai JL-2]|uniref:Beta-propeller repeat protein n=1 Tax=Thermus oshimai JL-2 TaxID=751945 RepID=K7R866_THEOS|nr:hypothetical protein [Thermus oshimai]AFV77234.1 hypothetical protein Theos_2243 [Thermus oshimai JL-2]
MHKTFGILASGLALLLAACTPPSSSNGGGNGTNPPSEIFAVLYEANGTKALAMASDGTYLYVAGFRQGNYAEGLQDVLVWKLNEHGEVLAKRVIGSELMPGGSPYVVHVNDRAYALALDGDYLYVAGYLAGCDDSNQDTCGGYPFVAKLRKDDLEFVQGFGGNDTIFNQPGLTILDQVEPYERSYAYTVTADENHLYVGGFGNVSSSASKGFLAVLDKSTGQEQTRLVLGGNQDGAVTHVEAVLRGNEAVDIAFGSTLYIAGHTNIPFDCAGNPSGPVESHTFGFLIRANIGDILDGNLCNNPANVVHLYSISPGPEELLALTITAGNSTRLFAAGICAFGPFGEGDITFTLSGQACLSQLDPENGNRVYSKPTYPDPDNYPGNIPSNCSEISPGLYKCADQARSVKLASDGSVLVTGHVKGSRQGPDRFPGTEDGLSGSDLFFARYDIEGHQVAYTLKDYGGGTDLGFAVVQGPGGYHYVAGATTGPLGNVSNSNPKAIVLRFGP